MSLVTHLTCPRKMSILMSILTCSLRKKNLLDNCVICQHFIFCINIPNPLPQTWTSCDISQESYATHFTRSLHIFIMKLHLKLYFYSIFLKNFFTMVHLYYKYIYIRHITSTLNACTRAYSVLCAKLLPELHANWKKKRLWITKRFMLM